MLAGNPRIVSLPNTTPLSIRVRSPYGARMEIDRSIVASCEARLGTPAGVALPPVAGAEECRLGKRLLRVTRERGSPRRWSAHRSTPTLVAAPSAERTRDITPRPLVNLVVEKPLVSERQLAIECSFQSARTPREADSRGLPRRCILEVVSCPTSGG